MSYKDNVHTSEDITIKTKRFKVNGKPTCLSWCGGEDHPRECCKFLISYRFGTSYKCDYVYKKIHSYDFDESKILKPNKNCPLWKEE